MMFQIFPGFPYGQPIKMEGQGECKSASKNRNQTKCQELELHSCVSAIYTCKSRAVLALSVFVTSNIAQ